MYFTWSQLLTSRGRAFEWNMDIETPPTPRWRLLCTSSILYCYWWYYRYSPHIEEMNQRMVYHLCLLYLRRIKPFIHKEIWPDDLVLARLYVSHCIRANRAIYVIKLSLCAGYLVLLAGDVSIDPLNKIRRVPIVWNAYEVINLVYTMQSMPSWILSF
jgi:hypothetical protein